MPAALIAALGYQRAHVFGTSLGGVIAQLLAVASSGADRSPGVVEHVPSRRWRLPSINPEEFPKIAALRSRLPASAAEFAQYFYHARLPRGPSGSREPSLPATSATRNRSSAAPRSLPGRSSSISARSRRRRWFWRAARTASSRTRTRCRWRARSPVQRPRSLPASVMSAPFKTPPPSRRPYGHFCKSDKSQERQITEEDDHGGSRGGSRHAL